MKLYRIVLFLIAIWNISYVTHADTFSAPIDRSPTINHSLNLQKYVTRIANYQTESSALKRRVHQTIAYYKKIHILKTITTTKYTIDCIPFAEQPALIDRPLAKNLLKSVREATKKSLPALKKMGSNFEFNPATQCPLGSVALLRPTKVMLTSTRANKKIAPATEHSIATPLHFHGGYSHQIGADNASNLISILTEASQAYFKGPQNQSVVSNNSSDHSLNQFWFLNKTYQQSGPTYSVEFGIIASEYFTTPASTSIFVFASIDDYGSNSCYNLVCGNFVQLPNTPVLGSPTNTNMDYIFQVTHTTLTQYINSPAYYLTLLTHDAASSSASVLLGYYADSIYPSPSELPQYFSAGAEVYADNPDDGTQMSGNYMLPYVGYNGPLQIEFITENSNYFPYYSSNGPEPYGLIWHLGQTQLTTLSNPSKTRGSVAPAKALKHQNDFRQ